MIQVGMYVLLRKSFGRVPHNPEVLPPTNPRRRLAQALAAAAALEGGGGGAHLIRLKRIYNF